MLSAEVARGLVKREVALGEGRRKEDAARELSRFLSSRSGQRSCFRSLRLRRPRSRSLRPDGELGPVGTRRRNAAWRKA